MERKEWFRDYLIEWVKHNRKAKFDELDPVARSKEMTRYYVSEIVSKLTPGLLPDDLEDIDEYIVDGPKDGGVDFFFRADGYVLIIQSKYHGKGKSEDPKELSHFAEVLSRLHDGSLKRQSFNRKVMEALSDIDWETDHFDLRFLTLGKADNLKDRVGKGATPVPELRDFSDRVELSLVDETELNKSLREAISADKEPEISVTVRFNPNSEGKGWIRFDSGSGRELYIGEVSGAEISEIYRPNKYRLFAMNIRDYVGDTATNKGIRDTAVKKPDDFVFFNNGVSAIATAVTEDANDSSILHCERFSIINGAQTVRSLVKAHEKDAGALKDVRVVLRIMQFRYSKDAEFLADVTKFNNTQNVIKISDFRSNDPVQKDLRSRFSKISVGAKTCDYKNKRRREADSNKFAISMDEFAKTIHAFRFGPDDMFGGTRYLFDTSPKGGYIKIYGEPVSHLDNRTFEILAGTYFLCSEVESLWRLQREKQVEDGKLSPALERRWMVYFAVGELLRMIYLAKSRDLDADLYYLSNPNKWINHPNHPVKAAITELFDMCSTAMEQTYGSAAKQDGFKHRNWFRSTATLDDVRRELSVIPKYRRSDLPTLRKETQTTSNHD